MSCGVQIYRVTITTNAICSARKKSLAFHDYDCEALSKTNFHNTEHKKITNSSGETVFFQPKEWYLATVDVTEYPQDDLNLPW